MNRVMSGVVFAGAMSLAGASAWALGCLENTTRNCCDVVLVGPDSTPCGSTTCVDVILANPSIHYVDSVNVGVKATVQQDTQEQCQWENRICDNGSCKQGSNGLAFCTPSKILDIQGKCSK
jgi:hypothetical protein